jgi:antitoxin ParD1/3/4
MATMNISIPDEMRDWVEAQVKTGRYTNASDYFRDLIRRNQGEVEMIRMALIEGEQSGVSKATVGEVIRRTRSKLRE